MGTSGLGLFPYLSAKYLQKAGTEKEDTMCKDLGPPPHPLPPPKKIISTNHDINSGYLYVRVRV
jgi:hypothetical protein